MSNWVSVYCIAPYLPQAPFHSVSPWISIQLLSFSLANEFYLWLMHHTLILMYSRRFWACIIQINTNRTWWQPLRGQGACQYSSVSECICEIASLKMCQITVLSNGHLKMERTLRLAAIAGGLSINGPVSPAHTDHSHLCLFPLSVGQCNKHHMSWLQGLQVFTVMSHHFLFSYLWVRGKIALISCFIKQR